MIPLLETNNVSLQIGKRLLCSELSLQIQPGEIWGILGSNGCGKTTLLQTIAGLLPKMNGEIYLEGKNIDSLSRRSIAQKLGILFQDTQDIFPQTVGEICYSGRHPHLSSEEDHIIVKQALIDMDLDTKTKQRIHTLSGGERKRLNIAALLAQTPRLYLLDEPINHLDLHYQVKILNHFKNLARNKCVSVLMSLHDINLAAHYCQNILLLFGDGQYLAGSTSSLLKNHHLTHLYQHPIEQIRKNKTTWWQAKLDA